MSSCDDDYGLRSAVAAVHVCVHLSVHVSMRASVHVSMRVSVHVSVRMSVTLMCKVIAAALGDWRPILATVGSSRGQRLPVHCKAL